MIYNGRPGVANQRSANKGRRNGIKSRRPRFPSMIIMPLLPRFRTLLRGEETSVTDEHPLLQPLGDHPPGIPRLKVGGSHNTPALSGISLSKHYAQVAQNLRSSMSSTCRWLDPEDIELVGEHPIGAGGSANIWEVIYNGRKVVLKSYRCYVSSNVAQLVAVRSSHTLCQVVHR